MGRRPADGVHGLRIECLNGEPGTELVQYGHHRARAEGRPACDGVRRFGRIDEQDVHMVVTGGGGHSGRGRQHGRRHSPGGSYLGPQRVAGQLRDVAAALGLQAQPDLQALPHAPRPFPNPSQPPADVPEAPPHGPDDHRYEPTRIGEAAYPPSGAEDGRQVPPEPSPSSQQDLDRPLQPGGQPALGLRFLGDPEGVHIELDDISDIGYGQVAAPSPIECPGPGDGDPVSGGKVGLARGGRSELLAQSPDHPGRHVGAGRNRHEERGCAMGARRAPSRPDLCPRVRVEQPMKPFETLLGTLLDPDDQVVHVACQNLFDGRQDDVGISVARVHRDHDLRHRERPSRRGGAQSPVGDEMRHLVALLLQADGLALSEHRARTLVPAQGAALGGQHRSEGVGPPAELDVLGPPLRERLVEHSHIGEERGGDAEVAAGDDSEDVVGAGCEVVGASHPAFDPFRVLHRSLCEQFLERTRPASDRVRVDALEVDMPPEAESHQIGGRVVPAGVGGQPLGFGHHVAVEEHDDVAGRRPCSVVSGSSQPEAQILLVDHAHPQRLRLDQLQRRVRAVIHHDHLEELARVGLTLQPGEGQGQRLGRLEIRDYDSDDHVGLEELDRRDREGAPVVSAHCCGRRSGHPSAPDGSRQGAAAANRSTAGAGLREAAISSTQL